MNFYSKRFEERYRSPLSQTITTTTPFSNELATLSADANAPPLLIPAKIPSCSAKLNSCFFCFLLMLLLKKLSIFCGLKIAGKYSSVHFLMPGILAPSLGCTPIILI